MGKKMALKISPPKNSASLRELEDGYQFGMEHAALILEAVCMVESGDAMEQDLILRLARVIRNRAEAMPGAKKMRQAFEVLR